MMKREKRKRFWRRLPALLLISVMVCGLFGCAGDEKAMQGKQGVDPDTQITEILDGIKDRVGLPKGDPLMKASGDFLPSDSMTQWLVMIEKRLGLEDSYEDFLDGLEAYVTEAYSKGETLDLGYATTWHRIILSSAACGGNPAAFGTSGNEEKINLLNDGIWNFSKTDSLFSQGANAAVWALLALDCRSYEVPKDSLYTREIIIEKLLSYQNEDGGVGLSGSGDPGVDMTAMALQALAPYQKEREDVALFIDRALAYLSIAQDENGMYPFGGNVSSESTSQVIIALCTLGIDPDTDSRFIKNGITLTDALMEFKTPDGGFAHSTASSGGSGFDLMASQQALFAFAAEKLLREGKGSVYRFEN